MRHAAEDEVSKTVILVDFDTIPARSASRDVRW
jgi:hypothetical protein